jgi:hypothetical protein
MREFAIAVVLSLLGAAAVVASGCYSDSRDACLIGKAMFPYVWGGLLIVLWPLAVGLRVLIVGLKPKDAPHP